MVSGARRAAGAAVVVLSGLSVPLAGEARGQSCRLLVYQFQPVPYDATHELANGAGPEAGVFEEGGPQVALWLESAPTTGSPPSQRGSHLFDLFVSARTGTFGIGNRPGNAQFGSAPRFPFGHRDNVLPVWAWARGRSYPLYVMQDGYQDLFTHPFGSSTLEPFYCRPLTPQEVVDALTCPTSVFYSDKGKHDPGGQSVLYPPRHDIAAADCQVNNGPNCINFCRDSPDCPLMAELDHLAAISG